MRECEIRRANSLAVDQNKLVGYAAVFGSWSRDLGGFVERVRPGAFRRSLEAETAADILALSGHDVNAVLGRVGAGTLQLAEDAKGLRYSIDLPDTSEARDLRALVARGDVSGASFGFRVIEDDWLMDGATARRELIDVELMEISVTALPAYPDTSVAKRHLAQLGQPCWQREAEERQRLLAILRGAR